MWNQTFKISRVKGRFISSPNFKHYNRGLLYLINSLCSVDRVDDVESRLFLGVGFYLDEDIGSNLTVLSWREVNEVTKHQRFLLHKKNNFSEITGNSIDNFTSSFYPVSLSTFVFVCHYKLQSHVTLKGCFRNERVYQCNRGSFHNNCPIDQQLKLSNLVSMN